MATRFAAFRSPPAAPPVTPSFARRSARRAFFSFLSADRFRSSSSSHCLRKKFLSDQLSAHESCSSYLAYLPPSGGHSIRWSSASSGGGSRASSKAIWRDGGRDAAVNSPDSSSSGAW